MVCLAVLLKKSVLALPGSPVDLAIPGIQSAAHEIAEDTTSMPDTRRFGRQQEKPRWLVVTCCEKCLFCIDEKHNASLTYLLEKV